MIFEPLATSGDTRKLLEARGGIEPPDKGFADLCLTTWLPRRGADDLVIGGADRSRTGDGGFADLCLTTWLPRQHLPGQD